MGGFEKLNRCSLILTPSEEQGTDTMQKNALSRHIFEKQDKGRFLFS